MGVAGTDGVFVEVMVLATDGAGSGAGTCGVKVAWTVSALVASGSGVDMATVVARTASSTSRSTSAGSQVTGRATQVLMPKQTTRATPRRTSCLSSSCSSLFHHACMASTGAVIVTPSHLSVHCRGMRGVMAASRRRCHCCRRHACTNPFPAATRARSSQAWWCLLDLRVAQVVRGLRAPRSRRPYSALRR